MSDVRRSRLEWLEEVDHHVSPEAALEIRGIVLMDIKRREAFLESELHRLREERSELNQKALVALSPSSSTELFKHAVRRAMGPHAKPQGSLVITASVVSLITHFLANNPGSAAGEIVEYVKKAKPDIEPNHVHSELHRCSREGGRFRKVGERPNTRYFINENAVLDAEVPG
jgi:hypothetical protein